MALVKAKFVVKDPYQEIPVHFNPSEYSIALSPAGQTNETQTDGAEQFGKHVPVGNKGVETLDMTLYFDTYTKYADTANSLSLVGSLACEDVRMYTEKIANLAGRFGNPTPHVSFVWGSLIFPGFVTSISQSFTMFMDDGKPVRAKLNVKMKRDDSISSESLGAGTRAALDLTGENWKLAVASVVMNGKLRDILGML